MTKGEEILNKLGKMECDFSSIEIGGIEDIKKHFDAIHLDFMRKSRFLKIKGKFTEVMDYIDPIIEKAEDDDILIIKLYYIENQILVIGAKVIDEEDYIDLAF